jgi:hypothetical protein
MPPKPNNTEGSQTAAAAEQTTVAAGPTGPTNRTVGTDSNVQRQANPQRVDPDYRRAKMTYLTITTEELGTLALSGGGGSVGLSGSIYFWKLAPSETSGVGLMVCIAVTLVCYIIFAGLFQRIRRRSDLPRWRLFGP